MSGVDVLAVIDSYVTHWSKEVVRTSRDFAINDAVRSELAIATQIRAAVAELIEKNEQLTKAVRAFADGEMSEFMRNQLFHASSYEPAKSAFADLCTANDECETALSRVRGTE